MIGPKTAMQSAAGLDACNREPIHTPGVIQPHGVLIALDAADLRVSHVSANFARSTGVPSRSALGLPLADLIGLEAASQVLKALSSERYSPANVLTLDLSFKRDSWRNVTVHTHAGRIILELEPASPLSERVGVVSRVQAIIGTLREMTTVSALCDRTAEALRALTGYDRVMVYRFNQDGHGEIVAEDRRRDLDSYLHLRYPASDIPSQARQLYLKQRIRVITDVGYRSVDILTGADHHDSPPLDMSYCALRGVSPVHLKYLRNMGVGATLVISLIQDGMLWGMIVCHHQSPHPVSADIRALCDLTGQLVMLLIAKVGGREDLERLLDQREKLALIRRGIDQAPSIVAGLAPLSAVLIDLVSAAGVAVRLNGHVHLFGTTPPSALVEDILADFDGLAGDDVVAEDALGRRFPRHAGVAATASGVLYLPVLNNSGDALVWFRPEVARTIRWGGNPQKAMTVDPETGHVSPRRSFAAWREIVKGTSLVWSKADIGAAHDLRRVITGAMLRHAEADLIRLSTVDHLTGLANRRRLEQVIGAWASSLAPPPAALLFVDLDRFKTVNDSLGHAAGDELLIQVARRLVQSVPAESLVARLGGDEFVTFVPGLGVSEAGGVATAMIRSFDAPFQILGRPHQASASIGIGHSEHDQGDLLRKADAAMYAAKRQGHGRAVFFENALHETALKKLRIEQDMFLAIQRNEFALVYQPIIDLSNASLHGFEALVRWDHPEQGPIAPTDFIPLAEDTGFIDTLGRWIAETAIADLAHWNDSRLKLSINVSPHQLASDLFVGTLQIALTTAHVAPSQVTIEVTEGVLMNGRAVEQLHRLRAVGCRIAIDDFGTGYSSLAYLRHLPIDVIKIDRSFVTPLGQDEKAGRFFEALVVLAHTLGITVVAEGVENDAQLAIVKAADCDMVQGYLLARPMTADRARALIASSGQ